MIASAGYPGSYAKGKIISGLDTASALPNTKVFHAGTMLAEKRIATLVGVQASACSPDRLKPELQPIVTSGGVVLGVTSWANDLRAAQSAAYAAVEKIQFEGAQFRHDIAAKAL